MVEAVGLLAALRARHDDELGFAPVTVIAGVFLALLMVSVSGSHDHAHGGGGGDTAHHHHHGDGADEVAHGPHGAHAAVAATEDAHAAHEGHGMDHDMHDGHDGHGGHAGNGDHVGQFRRLFWIMLILAAPVVGFSGMFSMLLVYSLPAAGWVVWISPLLGTVMYAWGGRPFLTGAADELAALEASSAALTDPPSRPTMTADAWREALGAYWAEHAAIETGADARSPQLLLIDTDPREAEGRAWEVRQVIADPDDDRDFSLVAWIDLDASDAAGEPVVRVTAFGATADVGA